MIRLAKPIDPKHVRGQQVHKHKGKTARVEKHWLFVWVAEAPCHERNSAVSWQTFKDVNARLSYQERMEWLDGVVIPAPEVRSQWLAHSASLPEAT